MRHKLKNIYTPVKSIQFWCCLVTFLLSIISSAAGSEESYFDTLAVNSEFSFGRVSVVHQGKEILWIGSENGLVGILGREKLSFEKLNSTIGSTKILSILEVNPNLLLVSTLGKGIFTLNLRNFNFGRITNKDGLQTNFCLSFHEINEYKILINCWKGISLLDVKSLEASNLPLIQNEVFLKKSTIKSIAANTNGQVWIALGEDGLYSFELQNEPIKLTNYETVKTASSVFIDSTNKIWVGSKNGIFRIEADGIESTFYELTENWHFYENRIKTMFEDSGGKIWASSQELFVFNEKAGDFDLAEEVIPMLKESKSLLVNSIDETSNGDLIFGSDVNGLLVIPKMAENFEILTDDEGKKFGTIEESLQLIDGSSIIKNEESFYIWKEGEKIRWIAKHENFVTAMEQINNTTLVFASDGVGLSKLDLESNEILPLIYQSLPSPEKTSIYSIDKFVDDKLLISVFGQDSPGLYLIDENSNSPLILNKQVDAAIAVNSDVIIAATREDGIFTSIYVNNSFSLVVDTEGKSVDCLEQFSGEKVWFCSPAFGLGYYDVEQKELKIIDSVYVRNSLFIRDILEDSESNIWVMTNSGLTRINRTLNSSFEFGLEEGIIEKDFSYSASIMLNDSKILVAGDKFNYIINSQVAAEFIEKRTKRLTSLTLLTSKVFEKSDQRKFAKLVNYFNSSIEDELLTLSSDEYLLILKFAANNFIDRHILGFEYRLLGLDNSWFSTTPNESTATYSTLPAGEYTFQVRVKDPKSYVEQPITSLKIRVLPPFWQTWQAYSLYVILAISLLFLSLKYRTLQLRQANKKLEIAVLDRTNELAKSESKIIELLKQKESLFAHASHEIRTPLSLILGPLQKLGVTLKDQNQIKQFEFISRNTKRLTVLVDQILQLEKLDSAKNTRLQNYSIGKSLASIVTSFQPIAELKSQQLTLFEVNDGVARLTEDSLEKIISNLLINAVKYCPNGSKIEVSTSIKNAQYTIRIADNGPGIPLDDQPRVFDRFIRTQNSGSISGTGLGLAVVKELLIANEGSICLDSQIGCGTTFIIQLPLPEVDMGAEPICDYPKTDMANLANEVNEQRHQGPIESTEESNNETILIIEDNADMRGFLIELLSNQYRCIEAVDGVDGLNKAIEFLPNLIITDLMMPLSDGFELTENIRSNELTAHIPIILLTAKGDDSSRMEGWKKAVDDYIAKPFNNDELILRIANLLSIRKIISRKFGVVITEEDASALTKLNLSEYYSERDKKFFDKFITVVEEHFQQESFNRSIASDLMCVSERQLNRKLNALIDYNFSDYLRKFRLDKAKKELEKGRQITEIAYTVGFSAPSYFSHCFKAEFGISPKAFVDNLKKK